MSRIPPELSGTCVPLYAPAGAAKMGGHWYAQAYMTSTGIYYGWWCNRCKMHLTHRFLRSAWPAGLMKRHRCWIKVEMA